MIGSHSVRRSLFMADRNLRNTHLPTVRHVPEWIQAIKALVSLPRDPWEDLEHDGKTLEGDVVKEAAATAYLGMSSSDSIPEG